MDLHPCEAKKPRVQHVPRTVRIKDILIATTQDNGDHGAEVDNSINTSTNVSHFEEKQPDSHLKMNEDKSNTIKVTKENMPETPRIDTSPLQSAKSKKIPLTPLPPKPPNAKAPVSPLIEFKKRRGLQRESL